MELFVSPFSCSFASRIVCLEANVPVTLRSVALRKKDRPIDESLFEKNSFGQVPTLVLDDGRTLTENAAVLLFLGDRDASHSLTPLHDSFERYELVQMLSFLGTELHKKINAQIFAFDVPEAVRAHAREASVAPLTHLENQVRDRETLLGNHFTVADAYLFWALTILPHGGVSLEPYPALRAYHARHAERPAVRAALATETREYSAALRDSTAKSAAK